VAIAGVLILAFPDKASDPRPEWVLPAAGVCVVAAAFLLLAMGWVAAEKIRSRIRSRARWAWRKRWMPGGVREAWRTKRHGRKASISRGSWSFQRWADDLEQGPHWECPYCLGDNLYKDSECYGCGAILDYERERVKWLAHQRR